jgi:hypothetical protein
MARDDELKVLAVEVAERATREKGERRPRRG